MIKATVRYTAEHFLALDSVFNRKPRIKKLIRTLALDALIYGYFIYFLSTTISHIREYDIEMNLLPICLLYAVLIFFSVRNLVKKLNYRRKLAGSKPDDRLCTFEFTEDEFLMQSEKEGYRLRYRIAYPKLRAAYEYEDFFLIGIMISKTAVIRKTELTEGTPDELRVLLGDKLHEKFRTIR